MGIAETRRILNGNRTKKNELRIDHKNNSTGGEVVRLRKQVASLEADLEAMRTRTDEILAENKELRTKNSRLVDKLDELYKENGKLHRVVEAPDQVQAAIGKLLKACESVHGIAANPSDVVGYADARDFAPAEIVQAADRLSTELVKPGRTLEGLLRYQKGKAWQYQRGIDCQSAILEAILRHASNNTEEDKAKAEAQA